MVDIDAPALTDEDRRVLKNPQVGGLILFSRNFETLAQLRELCAEVHALRSPRLLIAVDQEGGRVQRFRGDFCALPPQGLLGERYEHDPDEALVLAAECAWLMGSELRMAGVDFSFAPVLDLRTAASTIIGDRAFHANPTPVIRLARAWLSGLRRVPMAAVGKHFPGHGCVAADSHVELPVDERDYYDIEQRDLAPFRALIASGIEGIMMAHVLYPQVDDVPAGYSKRWIHDTLRRELGFEGVVFSDDLSMAGADLGGDYAERAVRALEAGCDMLLVCNNRTAVHEVLERLGDEPRPLVQARLMRMHARGADPEPEALRASAQWRRVADRLAALDVSPELGLGDDNLLG